MKRMKKLFALLIAMVMVLGMSTSVFAAQSSANTITVNGAKAGETYKAYKMLELYVNDTSNPSAYAYTVASDWANFFADSNSAVWGTVLEKDATGTYFQAKSGVTSETAWSSSSALSAFAEAAAKYAKDNSLTPVDTDTPTGTTATLNTTESGYYLVTSTLGTIAMIDTTPGDVTINEKNSEDTIEKEVKEDSTGSYGESNDVQVGDTVEFKSTVKVAPRSINVVIHDTMDSGLTFSGNSSIKLYTDAALTTELASTLYEIKTTPDTGDTFTIKIKDAFAAETTADAYIYITYTAVVNNAAVVKDANGVAIVDQNNKTKVSFGDGTTSTEDSTTTTTHKFEVKKYATGIDNLANAIFQLKKGETVVNLIKLDDTNYRVADATEATTGTAATHVAANNEVATVAANSLVSDFVTVSSGNTVIWGLDSDSDYSIVEIQAPKGYNMLNPASTPVTVESTNATVISVENQSGTELPSTGGIGTTIFYVIGAILVIGAGVVLVSRRRAN